MEKKYKIIGLNIFTKDDMEFLESHFFPQYDSERFTVVDSSGNKWVGVLDNGWNRHFLEMNGYTKED